ncbi:class I SAM-dependent methyltransferase [Hymenobacter jeongseonensis]|nr:class I SAM-dependent methyltransferase [Hymenobacter jeongseonensis]
MLPIVASLAASTYVYDYSNLYRLNWLPSAWPANSKILTVSAGFDEISSALLRKYSPLALLAVDFYDPARHTEVSIKRARRAYAPFPGTQQVDTRGALPAPDDSMDLVFAFLSAHEIRDAAERAAFFRELKRVTKPAGSIIVTEHLRDPANFLAYSVGFMHFHSRRAWHATCRDAGLQVQQEIKITPLVTAFILCKNGSAA